MTWYVSGPVLLGSAGNDGTLPRGLWIAGVPAWTDRLGRRGLATIQSSRQLRVV